MTESKNSMVLDSNSGSRRISGVDYEDEYRYVSICETILKNCGNLRLVGETGCGKTKLAYKLAENLNAEFFEVVLTRDTTRFDLLGSEVLINGKTEFRDGIVTLWLKSKYKGFKILYIDGFNYSEPNINALVESLADFRGNVFIPELKAVFTRTDKHLLIISFNPSEKAGYAGTFLENIATIRRFEGIVVKYLSERAETKLLQRLSKKDYNWCRKMVALANKTRILYKEGKLRTPLTTGNILNYADLSEAGLTNDELMEIAESLFPETERGIFRKCFESEESGSD